MDERVCMSKQLKWNKFPFYGDSLSEKITQVEQSPLIRGQVVWRNYSEQLTKKQKSVKTCTRSLKKKTPPLYGNRCNFDQKRKGCPYEAGLID